jgi:acyl-coenzyme A synthetase/AMP-(fatty) acid ligase/acyl carrier protein
MRVLHHYGSTETTVGVVTWEVGDSAPSHLTDDVAILGHPFPGVDLHVLDASGRPVAPGSEGELHVGGRNVGRGYLRRPAETARAFVPDPFGADGARMFRMGDVVQLLPTGELRFVGRTDGQVKVRGHRLELGEIEAAMAANPRVRLAAAISVPDETGEPAVHGYYVTRQGESLPPAEMRRVLAAALPPQAVPHVLEVMPTLPATPSGKVDRRTLRRLVVEHPLRGPDSASDAGDLARMAALAWSEVLGALPTPSSTFLDAGGDSLRAVRLAGRLQRWTGRRVTAASLFEHRTYADLVRHLGADATS